MFTIMLRQKYWMISFFNFNVSIGSFLLVSEQLLKIKAFFRAVKPLWTGNARKCNLFWQASVFKLIFPQLYEFHFLSTSESIAFLYDVEYSFLNIIKFIPYNWIGTMIDLKKSKMRCVERDLQVPTHPSQKSRFRLVLSSPTGPMFLFRWISDWINSDFNS